MPWHYWGLWIFVVLSAVAFFCGIQMTYERINFLIDKIKQLEEDINH